MRLRILLVAMVALAAISISGPTAAQDAPAVSVAGGGLINPRGVTWDADGALVVAEAGTGGEAEAEIQVPPPTGPYRGGPTARVSRIVDGCAAPITEDLASAISATGEPIGVADVAVLGDRLVALVTGGGESHANPESPAGLYELAETGPVLLADLGAWLGENTVASPPPDEERDIAGIWPDMAVTAEGDAVLVVERTTQQIVQVTAEGEISRVADTSELDLMPTSVAVGGDGEIYVGFFSQPPYAAGSAAVYRLNDDGSTEPVWTGLTMVNAIAVAPDGTLYAAELSEAREQPPFFVPGTGRVVRQTGPDTFEEVLTQVNLPTALAFGPDDALYVSLPAVGADNGTGVVLRVDVAAQLPLAAQSFDLTAPGCLSGGEASVASITITDAGFEPAQLTVSVGTTVVWTNAGAEDHLVASAGSETGGAGWDSGFLRPGTSFSVTFTEPGVYPYSCSLHPDETTGTIEVVS